MRRVLILSVIVVVGVAAGFAVYVDVYPRYVMDKTLTRIAAGGENLNRWRMGRRPGPKSRGVVRPSPDLAYAICVYDLAQGPLRVRIAPWDDYWSLSLYAANTDNYWTANDVDHPDGIEITVVHNVDANRHDVVVSPTRRGAALIRRLAPTPERHRQASELNASDVCKNLSALPE